MEGSSTSAISCRAASISARRFFSSLRASRESCAPYRVSMAMAGSACAPCMTSALVSMLTISRSRSSFSNAPMLSARLSRTSERPGISGMRQSCWASAARSSASAPMASRRTMSRVSAGRWRAIRVKAQRAAPPMVSSSSGTNLARALSVAGSPLSPSRATARAPAAGSPRKAPAPPPADGLILQRNEPGQSVERGGVADLTQQGDRADHQPVVVVQQILAVSVEDAQQQRSAIGAARQYAIDQGGVDGLEAGHEGLGGQAVRLQLGGDGGRFVREYGGRVRHVGPRQPLLGLG